MTKKHFIELADAIRCHDRGRGIKGDNRFMPEHLDTLIDFCASQNPNFNRERWLAYLAGTCGSNGGTIKPPRKPRSITPERKLARRLEGKDFRTVNEYKAYMSSTGQRTYIK